MNRLRQKLVKVLALLAVVMLPVEQTLASACCCRLGHTQRQRLWDGIQQSRCAEAVASCCGSARSTAPPCCNSVHADGPKPCPCPAGCFSQGVPNAVSPPDNATIPAVDLFADRVGSAPTVSCAACAALTQCPQLLNPTSASQRCVLLCRYRL